MMTEEKSNKFQSDLIGILKKLSQQPVMKYVIYAIAGLIVLVISGKVVRILAGTLADFKVFNAVLKS